MRRMPVHLYHGLTGRPMSETKDRRRQRNAEAGAVGKLGRDRQSAMVKALQNIETRGRCQR